MDRKKIGIFSGSFNPIHAGHLMLANYMCEFTELDEVWFVVTPHNPLKNADDLLADDIRLQMAQLAVHGFHRLRVSDVEFSMPRPSYTIDTLTKLSDENPDKEFILIIGGDNWLRLPKWKNSEQIIEKHRILIYPRLGEEVVIPETLVQTVRLVDAPVIEISSTFIRQSIRAGKNVRAFVSENVWRFIVENRLYAGS